VYSWTSDLRLGDTCEAGFQLRPHIVWFGEAVPLLETAAVVVSEADIVLIVGTSMQVYPAASLIGFAKSDAFIYYIDPKPHINYELSQSSKLKVINEKASTGVPSVVEMILKNEM
jgi:NAD-dependent deacetylase